MENEKKEPICTAKMTYTMPVYRAVVRLQQRDDPKAGALKRMYIVVGAVCLSIAAGLLVQNFTQFFAILPYLAAFGLVGAFSLTTGLNTDKVLAKRYAKNNRRRQNVTYAFFDEYMSQIEPAVGENKILFSEFTKLYQLGGFWFFFSGQNGVTVVDTADLDKETKNIVMDNIRTHSHLSFEKIDL